MKRLVIFASGTGTNAENIIRYFRASGLARVVLVICNQAGAPVIGKSWDLGVPALVIANEDFKTGEKVLSVLQEYRADLLILAGFLRLVPKLILESYTGKIINIHPSLLPKYGGKGMYGMKVHEAVIAHHEKESGMTIHYVNDRFDEGEIIFQARVPLAPEDTPESVQRKVHELEMKNYPVVIEKILG